MDIKEQLKDIKTQLRLSMNGAVSQSMREKGLVYKLNFGVELPRIKTIAEGYEKNHDLAQALWKEEIRECKILAGTLGILTNPEHPVFSDFPTEFHTNWQWYPIIKHSYPLILDGMPKEYRPIVQVIDNVERNHKLGLLIELNVEGGKLLLCMSDLDAVRNTPEGLQFYAGLLEYMNSSDFKPSTSLSAESFKNLFETGTQKDGIKVLENISYE